MLLPKISTIVPFVILSYLFHQCMCDSILRQDKGQPGVPTDNFGANSTHKEEMIGRLPFMAADAAKRFLEAYHDVLKHIDEHIGTDPPDDIFLSSPQLIQKYGYPSESHEVITSDGYILSYHRIPYGKTYQNGPRKPVLVQHGLFSESTHWLTQPEHNCLPYILANAGYDVWLGNARGNRYSRKHVQYDTSDSQFWDTEWHDMGTKDLTAGIDYILKETGFPKLNYIGHSMGTTMFLVLMAMLPEYNEKVGHMIAYAPPIYMKHVKSPPCIGLMPILGVSGISSVLAKEGYGEFFPHYLFNHIEHDFAPRCGADTLLTACTAVVFAVTGFNKQRMNMTHLPVILGTFPSSSPTAAAAHYFQEMTCVNQRFQRLDLGAVNNLATYGSLTPPSYEFSKMTVPKTVFYSTNDCLVGTEDVEATIGKIPNTNYVKLEQDDWGHMDFLWAQDAYNLVHPKVLEIFRDT